MNRNTQTRFAITAMITLILISAIVFPLILRIPLIKKIALFSLSFTKNPDYQIAYVETWSVLIGSFIAIFGALWTQRKINSEEKRHALCKYACAVYYDLHFSFQELIRIHDETKRLHNLEKIEGETAVLLFCQTAVGHELPFSQNWIDNLSNLSEELSPIYFERIYKCYTKLESINRALRSRKPDQIFDVYVQDICWLIAGNEKQAHQDINQVLEALHSIKEGSC